MLTCIRTGLGLKLEPKSQTCHFAQTNNLVSEAQTRALVSEAQTRALETQFHEDLTPINTYIHI